MEISNNLATWLTSVTSFFKSFSLEMQELLKQYKVDCDEARSKVDVDDAQNTLIYGLIKLWVPKILVPSILIIAMAYLVKEYFVFVVLTGYGIYYLQAHSTVEPQQYSSMTNYIFVRNFIFDVLRGMSKYLPIETPQTVTDIVHLPEIDYSSGCELFLYKLRKLTPERTDDQVISFAEKVLTGKLNHCLDKYEASANDRSTYFFDQTRKITPVSITDMGDHYLIQIAFVNSPQIYEYVNRKDFASSHAVKRTITDLADVDF